MRRGSIVLVRVCVTVGVAVWVQLTSQQSRNPVHLTHHPSTHQHHMFGVGLRVSVCFCSRCALWSGYRGQAPRYLHVLSCRCNTRPAIDYGHRTHVISSPAHLSQALGQTHTAWYHGHRDHGQEHACCKDKAELWRAIAAGCGMEFHTLGTSDVYECVCALTVAGFTAALSTMGGFCAISVWT